VSIGGAGYSVALALGGSIAPGLILGATIRVEGANGSLHGSPYGSSAVGITELGLLVDWYPNADIGWHLGGEGGFGDVLISPSGGNADMSNGSFGGAVFGGYDWRLTDSRWAFGVLAVASGVFVGNLQDAHNFDTGYRVQGFATSLEGTVLFF
jgi:hypothetical protein